MERRFHVFMSCVRPQSSWPGWLMTWWSCGPTPILLPPCRSWRTLITDAELRSLESQRGTAVLLLQELNQTDIWWHSSIVCSKIFTGIVKAVWNVLLLELFDSSRCFCCFYAVMSRLHLPALSLFCWSLFWAVCHTEYNNKKKPLKQKEFMLRFCFIQLLQRHKWSLCVIYLT